MDLVYKYTTAKVGLKHWLRDGEVCFTSIPRLNDRFEGQANLGDLAVKEREADRERIRERFRKQYCRRPTRDELNRYMDGLLLDPSWQILGHVVVWRALMLQFKRVGVLSLSKSPTIALMWSHYARMSGMVLGINSACPAIAEAELAGLLGPQHVSYKDERVRFDSSDRRAQFQALCLTKGPLWAYEQEVRCFREVADDTKGFIAIPGTPSDIKEIVVGIAMEMTLAGAVWDIAKEAYPDASIQIAIPKPDAFEIEVHSAPAKRSDFLRFFDTSRLHELVGPRSLLGNL